MKFSEVVAQTLVWLQREGRVSYRALRLEFDLTDDVLDVLKEELIEVKELAVDKDGKMLVWVGPGINGEKDKGVKGEDGLGFNIQSLESRPLPIRPHISPSVSAQNKRQWKPEVPLKASARRSRPCLPISKARRHSSKDLIPKRHA